MQTPSHDIRAPGSALRVARSIATSRPGLVAIAAAAIGGGLALNWSGLVAMGAAPLILRVAPCVAMCALGLCMPMGRSKPGPATSTLGLTGGDKEPLVIEGTAIVQSVSPVAPQGSGP